MEAPHGQRDEGHIPASTASSPPLDIENRSIEHGLQMQTPGAPPAHPLASQSRSPSSPVYPSSTTLATTYKDHQSAISSALPTATPASLNHATQQQITNNRSHTQKKVHTPAWRYKGYPAFSAWAASDNDFCAVRRFSVLHTRTILMLQDEIVRMEKILFDQDQACRHQILPEDHEYLANSGSFRSDEQYQPKRAKLLCDLAVMLKRYG